jgi:O-antigen/teichoic acid export membrane protein
MWVDAVPLLLNSLLMTVFFRFDAIILRSVAGDTVLGLYDAAYKVVSLTQIIPPYVVGALFPLLAHRAVHDRATLNPLVSRAIGVLQLVAWVGVVIVTIMADDMIWLLGGTAYLPGAATALRVLIWYLPLSYTTGVVQYALIAIARQKAITWAFLVGTVVNVGGNLLLIPQYGALAAAVMTITTEVALLASLWPTLRREGIAVPLPRIAVTGLSALAAVGVAMAGQAAALPRLAALAVALIGMVAVVWRLGYVDAAITERMTQLGRRVFLRIRK